MGFEFNNTLRNNVMYIERKCNIVSFSIDYVATKLYCLSKSNFNERAAICHV